MTLNQLQYFSAAARELHFGRAAQLLHISQPSLSSSVAALEEELGIALFERRGRAVFLTEAGCLLQKHADRILEQVASTQRQIELLKASHDTEVRLSYTSTMLAAGLPRILHDFTVQWNDQVRLSTDEVPSTEAVQKLKDGKYDLAICMKTEADPELNQRLLFQSPYVLVVPKDSPLTEDCSLEEVASHPFVVYRASPARAAIETLFASAGITPDFRHYTYSDDDAMHFVGNGLGVSIVDALPYLERNLVRALRPKWLIPYTHNLYLTSCAGRRHGRAVQLLENYLVERFQKFRLNP